MAETHADLLSPVFPKGWVGFCIYWFNDATRAPPLLVPIALNVDDEAKG